MKILRILLIILVILVAAIVILGLVAPKETVVERTVTINAPQTSVAGQMFHFSNFKNWSPWQELDPDMKTTLTGEDGKAGSVYSWEGNDKVGAGSMTNESVTGDEMIVGLHFLKPWESKAKVEWHAKDAGNNQTNAVWKMTSESPFPWNGLMMVMGMKKMMEKDFDKGLNNLKDYVESGKAASGATGSSFDIKETQFAGGNYAGIRKTVSFSDMDKFFANSYETIGKAAGSRINGKGVGIYYNWDETKGTSDMAAAFSVTGTEPVAGAKIINIPSSPAYMVVYKGGYYGSYAAHRALTSKLKEAGKEQQLCVEEYIVNPGDTKDSNMYVTNIYYLVK